MGTPEESNSNVQAHDTGSRQRQKVTHACEGCRRRRVKCDGFAPCSNCSKQNIHCNFDHTTRGRRGPRPRPNGIHLASTRQILKPLKVTTEFTREDSHASFDISVAPDVVQPEPIDDLAEDNFLHLYQRGPPLETLRQCIMKAMNCHSSMVNCSIAGNIMDIDAICHFVELFWTNANFLYGTLIHKDQFLVQEREEQSSLTLYMSMCTLGALFSSHNIAREDRATSVPNSYECIARAELIEDRNWGSIVPVQCYTLLGLYCAGQNKGAQAWVDFATARSRIQIFKAMVPCPSSSEAMEMDRIEHLITFAEGVTSLGNLKLQNQIFTIDVLDDIWAEEINALSLFRLVELLAQMQQACSVLLPSHEDLPWEPHTVWRSMDRYLEKYPMRHPDKFCSDLDTLNDLVQGEAIERIVSVMIWHACVLQLNRPLLRTPAKEQKGSSIIPQADDMSARGLFLQERHFVCQSSASTICVIAQKLVDNDHFFAYSSLVGYCCFQAGLVLVYQNHHAGELKNEEIQENLQLVFEILRSLQTFHFPASQWLEVLSKVQDPKFYVLHDVGSENTFIVRPYFDRFHNIQEAAFMCLTPPVGDRGFISNHNHASPGAALASQTQLGDIGGVTPAPEKEINRPMLDYPDYLDGLCYAAEDFDTTIAATD